MNRKLPLLLACLCLFISSTIFSQTVATYNMSTTTVSDTVGYLFDEGGATGNYFPDSDLAFTITSSNGKPITIRFDEFSVETNELGSDQLCIYDFVEIFDGADVNATSLGSFCGETSPGTFTSTGSSITIQFTSDGAAEMAGFKMAWSTGQMPNSSGLTYCDASGPTCGSQFFYIRSFTFNSFTNVSNSCDAPYGTYRNYSDFTDLIINYEVGETILIFGLFSGALLTEVTVVYIDWNQDGDFDDAGEASLPLVSTGIVTGEFLGTMLPPLNPKLGYTRVRVRTFDPVFGLETMGACGTSSDGEVEDYTILVTDPANPLPICASLNTPADNSTNTCLDLDFTWDAVADADGYDFTLAKVGSDFTDVFKEDLTATSTNVANLKDSTEYYWTVEAYNENGTALNCDTFHFTTGNLHPIVRFDSDSIALCQNEDYVFDAAVSEGDGTYNYAWSGTAAAQIDDAAVANPVLIDKTEGSYIMQLQVTDGRSCLSNLDSQLVVIKTVYPAEPLDLLNPNACSDEDILMLSNANANTIFQESNDSLTWAEFPANYLTGDSMQYIIPFVGQKYFRTIQERDGCVDTSSVVIQQRFDAIEKPLVDLFQGSLENCEGDTVLVQAANYNANILWSNGATSDSLQIENTTELSYIYTDSNNCQAYSDTLQIGITKIAVPLMLNLDSDTAYYCQGGSLLLVANNKDVIWNDVNATENDTLEVNSVGVYKATITLNSCFFESDSIVIEERATPSNFSLSYDESQNNCEGLDTLLVTGVSNMEWMAPSTTSDSIFVTESGVYFGQIINEFGCIGYSDTLSVTFYPIPEQPEIITVNDSVITTTSSATVYTWYKDGEIVLTGTGEDTLVLADRGDYTLVVANEGDCQSDTSESYRYIPTGISVNAHPFVEIYPNPTEGALHINNLPNGLKSLIVLDSKGSVVFNKSIENNQTTLQLNGAKGVYFLQISGEKEVSVRKIVLR